MGWDPNYHTGKTVREHYNPDESHHKNAIPYTRKAKHKESYKQFS